MNKRDVPREESLIGIIREKEKGTDECEQGHKKGVKGRLLVFIIGRWALFLRWLLEANILEMQLFSRVRLSLLGFSFRTL